MLSKTAGYEELEGIERSVHAAFIEFIDLI
jgi:hypothetical protein